MIDMNKDKIIEVLKKYNFDKNSYVVISGAAMTMLGIKDKTNDIDIAVTKDYYNYLIKNYKCEFEKINFNNNKVYFIDNIINFGIDFYCDPIYINNIPVQQINEIINLKKILNREKDKMDIELINKYKEDKVINKNSLVLAYLGDAIYEVYIRKYLIDKNICKVNILQKEATKFVSAKAQASYLKLLLDNDILTEEEKNIVICARNHKNNHKPKNCDIITYKYATGLEALIGYLYLNSKFNRIGEIINYIIGR